VNWKPGEDVVIAGSVSDEEARTLHPHGWKNVTPYMRVTRQPGLDQSSETRATERQPA
jgi:hypothetical protein